MDRVYWGSESPQSHIGKEWIQSISSVFVEKFSFQIDFYCGDNWNISTFLNDVNGHH